MNTQRIAAAVKEIDKLSLALGWLREFGDALIPNDRNSFKIHIDTTASACTGAAEARQQMEAVARLHIAEIVRHAITDAKNTIEINTSAIKEQAR